MPVLVWALGSRVVPDLLAPIDDTSRLSAPIGHANGLALIAVFAVPGAVLLASTRRWRDAGTVIAMGALLVVALTGSRSGILALVGAVAVALWMFPARDRVARHPGSGNPGQPARRDLRAHRGPAHHRALPSRSPRSAGARASSSACSSCWAP